MASVQWRRNKQVTVYYYDNQLGKLTQVPREITKHLDGKPKDFVYKWVEDWEKKHGRLRARSERSTLSEDDLLFTLWTEYQADQKVISKRRDRTAEVETEIFFIHILPFFVGTHRKKDPADWHGLVPDFHGFLFKKKLADATKQKTLWTLERFGSFLVYKQHMTFPFVVRVPKRDQNKTTPLKIRKTPDEVIAFAKTTTYAYADGTESDIDFNLAVLLGYFAGLSPSELFALSKEDLLTGADAAESCKTLEGFRKIGLGSKLGVVVNKTLLGHELSRVSILTKNDYRTGVVNVWHAEAAKLIAAMAKDKPTGRLFPYSRGWLERAWRELVKPGLGCTPHDLRRASCLFLGRTVRMPLTLLQEHMRHASIETTMLYCREPDVPEETRVRVAQDFDDVA